MSFFGGTGRPMKKYLRLTCTTCKRSVDKLVNLTHFSIDQCTITLGCEGRLQPVEYRSGGGIAVAPETGVIDWRPRASRITDDSPLIEPTFIDLSTGSKDQLVLGAPIDAPTYDLTLQIKADSPKTYRQYVFRVEGYVLTVTGIENGLEQKALRFTAFGTNPDLIEVFVNGVKRERGTDPDDFQVYDGSNSISSNVIKFNTPISGTGVTQIDVIVSKAQSIQTQTLVFKRNVDDESRIGTGAYENVDYVERLLDTSWIRYYTYTLDLADANIPLNSLLIPLADVDALLLLARKPYSILDRYTSIALPLTDLSLDRDFIKYYVEARKPTARASSTGLATIFPALRVHRFNVERTLRTSVPGVEEQLVLDDKVVIGPDT